MDPTALAALIQEAVPSARIEFVPSIDQQITLYSHRDDVVAVAGTLRDHPQLRFALLVELTAVVGPGEKLEHRRRAWQVGVLAKADRVVGPGGKAPNAAENDRMQVLRLMVSAAPAPGSNRFGRSRSLCMPPNIAAMLP